MFCPDCGTKSIRRNKFCSECGAALQHVKRAPGKPVKPRVEWPKVVMGVAAFSIVVMLFYNSTKDKITPSAATQVQAPIPTQLTVEAITARFDCFCGQCEHTLTECTCEHENGAKEVKAFIAQKILEDHHEPHIVEMVRDKYGKKDGE